MPYQTATARFTRTLCAGALLLAGTMSAIAQTDTTFTYQGELQQMGQPASGTYNIDFSLWNAVTGGSQVGSAVMFNNLSVADGVFTADLDFGVQAFGNTNHWLEITVNGTELSPRTRLSASPFSVQTRGIYVDANKNVGIGTNAPEAPLHVMEGSAGAVTAHSSSSAVFERSSSNYVSILSPDSTERGLFFGDPQSPTNGGILYNTPAAPDGMLFRTGGNISRMRINSLGDFIVHQQMGIGNPSQLPGQLTIVDSGQNALFAISADSAHTTYPTIFASNSLGPSIWAWGASEAQLSGGGTIVVGSETGNNLAIDTNEIMARSGGQPATLQLNPEGGQISMGMHGVHPTYAYGKILENGTIVSASSNVTAVTTTSTGFIVQISGGITDTDIAVASDAEPTSTGAPVIARCQRSGSDLHILTWNPLDSWDGRAPISFVIYRP